MNSISYELSEQHVEQLHQLYQTVWWANTRSLEDTKRCVEGSSVCVAILDESNQLIGFARVVTDFIYKGIIFDVIVNQQYRGQGLGQQLMKAITSHPQLQAVQHLELYCLPEMEAFYQEYGFSLDVGGVSLMRCVNG